MQREILCKLFVVGFVDYFLYDLWVCFLKTFPISNLHIKNDSSMFSASIFMFSVLQLISDLSEIYLGVGFRLGIQLYFSFKWLNQLYQHHLQIIILTHWSEMSPLSFYMCLHLFLHFLFCSTDLNAHACTAPVPPCFNHCNFVIYLHIWLVPIIFLLFQKIFAHSLMCILMGELQYYFCPG